MKKLLTVSKGEHLAARVRGTLAVLLIGMSLGLALWTATTPLAQAQGSSAEQTLQSKLPANTSLAKANKNQVVQAVGAAVQGSPRNIGQFVSVAAQARKGDAVDIVAAAIRALGTDPDCDLVVRAVEAGVEASPKNAAQIVENAVRVAGTCGPAVQQATAANRPNDAGSRGDAGEGNFGNTAGNQNPPPGSISGGGGSQSGRCQVCHRDGQGRGRTLTISCNAVPAHIRHGDTEGPCPVTPTQNP